MSRHRKKDDSTDVLKVLLIIAVLAIVCSLLFGGQHYIKNRQEVNSPEENKQSKNMTKIEDENETQNVVEEQKTEETKEEEPEIEEPKEETKEEEENEEVSINDDEKARELAKKEYGTEDGVYFIVDQPLGNGVYAVSVRDKETTSAIEWYTVNVRTGIVQ